MWVNCFSNHNELTISPLGTQPFAPSVFWRKESLDNDRLQNDRFDAQLLALDKRVTGRLDAAWRWTDRHRDELEQLKDSVQELEGRILELEGEKVALELGMERLSERLCCC